MSEEENVSVETVSATNITSNSALLTGRIVTEIVDYKPIDFGIMIAESESSVASHGGRWLSGDKLLGQTFSITATGLSAYTQYYYRAYLVLNNMQYEYGDVKSFKTEKASGGGGKENNHEYVDLGLSVKWATCNVGASKPEEYGDYFAWGETSPKTIYEWSNYKYCKGSATTLTKYCVDIKFGTLDNKTVLDLADDAAHVNWGSDWRMPTKAEQDELRNNCTWTWTTQNGVMGCLVTSKKNSNSIFLPASGYRGSSSLYFVGSGGYYWSSSLRSSRSDGACDLFFDSDDVDWGNFTRACGLSVRPVCK